MTPGSLFWIDAVPVALMAGGLVCLVLAVAWMIAQFIAAGRQR